ncbi:MAG TPA: 3-hydroxyacyl-CoA dehydrogenase family protein [Mycobacteriales bacterium]|jgi:3-hydroxybutyryl-CoA dehydrogenase|nr:3-hydroxyacyl-CoA dehydrogenase family protein [Mycobacteriales bacterium]
MHQPGELFVVGAGLMGSGIAQTAAQAGWQVALHDASPHAVTTARENIDTSLRRFVAKGTMTEEQAAATRGRITLAAPLRDAAGAAIVVEAVFEDLELKRRVFAELDEVCGADTLLASNTSAIPITEIAANLAAPERVVGTHFFSPVQLMPLCEVVRGERTAESALARAVAFAEQLGKTTVVVRKDVAGFVTTRLVVALVMEAVRLVEAGVATPEDIDTACRLGFGHRMGPLATCDLTGADVLRAATNVIHAESGQDTFVVPGLLNRMVAAGELGRKTGRGFYDYDAR